MSARGAFTLLELLLTLAVLAAIAAVTIPQLSGVLGDSRLTRSAEQLRVEMTRLRVRAMREGRTFILEAAPEAGEFRIRPFVTVADATESMSPSVAPSALLSGAKQDIAAVPIVEPVEPKRIELPEGVVIADVQVASAIRGAMVEQRLAGGPMGGGPMGGGAPPGGSPVGGGGRPILFYPDGSSSTAVVTLRHEKMGAIQVRLRGITADATIFEGQP